MNDDVKVLYEGKYLSLVERNGWEFTRRKTHDVAIILPVLDNGDLILISEFRQPLQKRVIGLPAGLVGDKDETESMIDGATRELQEETGYLAKTMECILKNSPSSSGLTDEVFSMFIARDLIKTGIGGGDQSEDIDVLIVSPNDLPKLIPEWKSKGYAVDPKIFIGLHFISRAN